MKRDGRAKLEGPGGPDAQRTTVMDAVTAKSAGRGKPPLTDAGAQTPAKRLPRLSGAASRLRRAAQLPGIRCVGNPGGQQHRQVNRPKNQCYRESLSWGNVRKRKCNHL